VARKRLEERDLRSLERRTLFSIFRPLDASERAAQDEPPRPPEPLLALPFLLLFPALLIVISVGLWLQLPAVAIWLSIVALFAACVLGTVLINPRR
jgi:pilus assembly protein TadC